MLYDKILVPVDGSNYSILTLREAVRIVKNAGGEITVVYVCSESSEGSSFVMPKLSFGCDTESILAEAERVAKSGGVAIQTLALKGDAVKQIVKAAAEGSFDLIVIGARGLSNLSGLVLGSVSQGVVKKAACPVLVVH
ncbi:universal stress protein [Candidatus Bathyarchaeota archaeon]|nr:universal stress protein [Candidatus Bathyarchaeota archaeon]